MLRRTFLKTIVAGGLTACSGRIQAKPPETAELAFRGLAVTMNPAQPFAQALAVRRGRILAVGSRREVEAVCDARTQWVELGGKCLSPGLIDAHSHLIGFGQMAQYFINLRPPRVHSFDSLRGVLADAAARTPPGEWIIGRGFDHFDEGRLPRREDLDTATPRHPVLLIHWSGQFGVANTLALKQANLLRADAPDPYGGKYLRDRRTGVPDGVLQHYSAIYSVHLPRMEADQQRRALDWAAPQFAREGVTCVHDNFCNPRYAVQYVRAEQEGSLPLRVRVYPYAANLDHCRKLIANVRRYRGPLVRLQGIKLAMDGYPLMYDVPQEHRTLNLPMHPADQFNSLVEAIHNADLQVDVHAVGDRGVDLTLAALRKAGGERGARRRHRIEHFMFRRGESIGRAAELGVPICAQPFFIALRGDDYAAKFGRRAADTMVPLASFRRAGVKLCFGADVPASPSHRPLDSIRCAMARRAASGRPLDQAESLTFLEALQAHTLDAAWAAFDEGELGSLEVGKQADLAVWSRDLRTIRVATDLEQLHVVATYLGGRATYTG